MGSISKVQAAFGYNVRNSTWTDSLRILSEKDLQPHYSWRESRRLLFAMSYSIRCCNDVISLSREVKEYDNCK